MAQKTNALNGKKPAPKPMMKSTGKTLPKTAPKAMRTVDARGKTAAKSASRPTAMAAPKSMSILEKAKSLIRKVTPSLESSASEKPPLKVSGKTTANPSVKASVKSSMKSSMKNSVKSSVKNFEKNQLKNSTNAEAVEVKGPAPALAKAKSALKKQSSAADLKGDLAVRAKSPEVPAVEATRPPAPVVTKSGPAKKGNAKKDAGKKNRKISVDVGPNEAAGALSAKWVSLQKKADQIDVQPYNMKQIFEEKTAIVHKVLGWGYILANRNDRLEVLFKDGIKYLISNYKP